MANYTYKIVVDDIVTITGRGNSPDKAEKDAIEKQKSYLKGKNLLSVKTKPHDHSEQRAFSP